MNFFKSLFKEKPGKIHANLSAAAYQLPKHSLGNQSPRRTMIALEPRIMFDGAAVATAVDTVIDATPPVQDAPAVDAVKLADAISPAEVDAAPQRIELVFIENNLADYQTLVNDVTPGTEVHVLDGSQDGLAQMAHILDGRSGIDAIHIISHGAEGVVGLGSLNLTAQNLQQHSADLANIGRALSQDADILVYGCNVSAGSNGAAFISALADLTQADVEASNDLTGAATKGGDWVLESASGTIEAAALQFAGFQGVLPSVAGTITPLGQADNTNYGTVFSDGEGGSTDISGIEYDIYFANASHALVNSVNAFTETFATPTLGLYDSEALNSHLGTGAEVIFKSSAGENFKLTSFHIVDGTALDGNWTVKAYENGSIVGTQQNFTITQSGEYASTVMLSSDFYNVDEIRISVSGGVSAGHVGSTTFSSFVVADPIVPDTTAPTVSTITRVDTATSNATSVQYTVTFDESVTGVDTSDFALTNTGTAGGTISAISGSGDTYTVTVSSVTGDGTFRLDMNSSGTGIADTATNAIATGFTSGEVYTFDHTAPAVGTPDLMNASDSGVSSSDNLTNKTTPNFTGTAEASSTIMLYDTDGSTVLGTTTANGMGKWTITSSTLSEGAHMVSAKATDAVGNVSSASSKLTVTIDTTAPVTMPDAPTLDSATDSGVSNSDGITSVSGPCFSGTGADANSMVNVYDADTTLLGTTLSDGSGNYTYSVSFLADGVHTITAKNVDNAGNIGPASSGTTITIDTATPTTTIATIAFSNDTGTSSTDFITKTAAQTISGTTDANLDASEIVEVSLDNGSTWATATTSTGSNTWSLSGQTLTGSDTLQVRVSDLAGNPNTAVSQAYVLDTTAPTTTIATASFSADTGTSSTDFITKTAAQIISGTTSSNLVSGEIVEVSLDNGGTWITATTSVGSNAWSLAGQTLTGIDTLKGRVADTAGNASAALSQAYVLDTGGPTVTVVVADSSLVVGETSLVTFTFDTAVTGFSNADLTIASGTLSAISSSDGGTTYTATFTPTASTTDATNLISVDNTGVTDIAGNAGSGSTDSNNYAIDNVRPTVSIVFADTALLAGETSLVTFTFSEMVMGFTNADLTIENGTLSAISSKAGLFYSATFTPTASVTDATNVITIDNTGVADSVGNVGSGSTDSNNYAIATARPTVGIVVTDTSLLAGETSLVTFTFSEAVTGFSNADLTIANGSLSAVSSSDGGVTYTATITPTASITDATNLISIDNTGVANAAGNVGTGSTDSNNYQVATVRPTVGIAIADGNLLAGETSLVTFTFSEAVTGFTNADLMVANGMLDTVSSSDGGATWTATLTPDMDVADASNVITVDNTGVANADGNAGTGSTNSKNYIVSTVRPTVTIVVADELLAAGETSLVTFTFSEAVTGFTNADLTIENGILSAVNTKDGGTTYTATFTPTGSVSDNLNVISLVNSGVMNGVGNAGSGTTDSNNYAVDDSRPTVGIVIAHSNLLAGEISLVTFTFSEVVTGFTNADLTIANGSLSAVGSTDGGTTYTAIFTPTVSFTDATNVISLNNTGIMDLVGNFGSGTTDSNNYAIDTSVATVAVASVALTPVNLTQQSGNTDSKPVSAIGKSSTTNNSNNTGNDTGNSTNASNNSGLGNSINVNTGSNNGTSNSANFDNASSNGYFSSSDSNSSSSQAIMVDMKLSIDSSGNGSSGGTINLPITAFAGLNTSGVITFTAAMSSGQQLPSWISVNPSTGAVTVKAGAVVTHPITVKVTMRDSQGKQVVVLVKVQPKHKASGSTESKPQPQDQTDDEKTQAPTEKQPQQQGQREQSNQRLAQVGRSGLTEQLKQTGSKGFELQRLKLLESLTSLVGMDAA